MEEPEVPTDGGRSSTRRAFVAGQVAALEPFDFVAVVPVDRPSDAVTVRRTEDGALTLDLDERDPASPFGEEQVAELKELGFTLEGKRWAGPDLAKDPVAAAELVERVLAATMGDDDERSVDIRHGSTRDEHEAAAKVAQMRSLIEPVLTSMAGQAPAQDADGDYLVDIGASRVFVAPRAWPDRPPIVRIFAITNAGLRLTPDLALFLCRLNFDLMFGRFSIDVDHQGVWLDETLLGEHVTDEELRFTVEMVATTAGEWDHKIAQMFGGNVRQRQPVPEDATPTSKPGQGGYL